MQIHLFLVIFAAVVCYMFLKASCLPLDSQNDCDCSNDSSSNRRENQRNEDCHCDGEKVNGVEEEENQENEGDKETSDVNKEAILVDSLIEESDDAKDESTGGKEDNMKESDNKEEMSEDKDGSEEMIEDKDGKEEMTENKDSKEEKSKDGEVKEGKNKDKNTKNEENEDRDIKKDESENSDNVKNDLTENFPPHFRDPHANYSLADDMCDLVKSVTNLAVTAVEKIYSYYSS